MIKTYLELKEQLESYEGILDPRIIKYFNDLIDLKYSVLREDKIDNKIRKVLLNLGIYTDIRRFNIYEGAMKIFKGNENKYKLKIVSKGIFKDDIVVKGVIDNKTFDIWQYYPGTSVHRDSVCLYNVEKDDEVYKNKTSEIENKINMIIDSASDDLNRIKCMSYIKKMKQKETLEKQKEKLIERKDLCDDDKYAAEVMNYYTNLFINEYGIDAMTENDKKIYCSQDKLPEKEFIKEYPDTIVKKRTFYR